ncbi:MAG: hypothetical protein U0746_09715 [Gemmataceae bacterium]
MTSITVETPELDLVPVQPGPGWKVTHHRLFAASPDDADKVVVKGGKVTVWDLCFLEDLFQATNDSKGLLLDVGWYPHADPTGSFRLVVVPRHTDRPAGRSPFAWDSPTIELCTRSLDEVVHKLRDVLAS